MLWSKKEKNTVYMIQAVYWMLSSRNAKARGSRQFSGTLMYCNLLIKKFWMQNSQSTGQSTGTLGLESWSTSTVQ